MALIIFCKRYHWRQNGNWSKKNLNRTLHLSSFEKTSDFLVCLRTCFNSSSKQAAYSTLWFWVPFSSDVPVSRSFWTGSLVVAQNRNETQDSLCLLNCHGRLIRAYGCAILPVDSLWQLLLNEYKWVSSNGTSHQHILESAVELDNGSGHWGRVSYVAPKSYALKSILKYYLWNNYLVYKG